MRLLNSASLRLLLGVSAFGPVALAPAFDPRDDDPAAPTPTAARLSPASIDAMFEAAWSAAGQKPLGLADDVEWLRRASLVLNGVAPAAEEVVAFQANRDADKRAKKVDELLARADYGEHWGGEWIRALVGRGGQAVGRRFDRPAFEEWVVDSFNKNLPMNEFARAVVTAAGTSEQNAAVGYVARWEAEPKDLAGQTAKVFLGLQIQCARCHDHKYEQWKMSEFNEFAAYFALTKGGRVVKGDQVPVEDEPERELGRAAKRIIEKQMEKRLKNAKNPEQAAKMAERSDLRFLDPSPLRPIDKGPFSVNASVAAPVSDHAAEPESSETGVARTRRERLADWMTAPGNPYFTRSLANRAVNGLFGYGVTNPVDDFRSDSEMGVPGLLDALATELERSHYDFKSLLGLLAKTKAFALTSGSKIGEKPEQVTDAEKVFARYPARPMAPEQLIDTILRATGMDATSVEQLKKLRSAPKGKKGEEMMEKMEAQLEKARTAGVRKFVTTFEDDEQAESIDFEGTIPQALLMMNGQLLSRGVTTGVTIRRAMEKNGAAEQIDWLYLSALARKPSSDERNKATAYLSAHGKGKEALEDVLWALLNSAEFASIH